MEWGNGVLLKKSMKFHAGGVGMSGRSSMLIGENGLWDDGGSAWVFSVGGGSFNSALTGISSTSIF